MPAAGAEQQAPRSAVGWDIYGNRSDDPHVRRAAGGHRPRGLRGLRAARRAAPVRDRCVHADPRARVRTGVHRRHRVQ
ncbi:hypothetical protein MICRO8M_130173 [Microbacterium sp. 8M]|nr:hypothetical protein MICRO8M_130173 [Microbacterium sp. 8M]